MQKTVRIEDAVGMVLPHDITEIVKDVVKKPAFKKGHIIRREDVEYFKRLGKDHIYVLNLSDNDIHENEAASIMAKALAGQNVVFTDSPEEGKIALKSAIDGLLRINKDSLVEFNMLGEVMCSTLHDYSPVKEGDTIAATRLIPLVGERKIVLEAARIAQSSTPVVQVLPLKKVKIGLVITGNEVFYGRIQDRFEQVLRTKAAALGSTVEVVKFAPDDRAVIAQEIKNCIEAGAEMIVTSGGMSVDPDDVTREGIQLAGAKDAIYGTPVLPGAMFLSGQIGDVPVLGLPACGMFHKITVFDLVLPRVLTGEKITRRDFAELAHGGLCRNCTTCHYPICSFGK
jgi:hypothetical protein